MSASELGSLNTTVDTTAITPKIISVKLGKNDKCTCGSNLKFKHCHGKEGGPRPIRYMYKNIMKFGRNDPCRCGSLKKYKKCCLKKDTSKDTLPQKDPQIFVAEPYMPTKEIAIDGGRG